MLAQYVIFGTLGRLGLIIITIIMLALFFIAMAFAAQNISLIASTYVAFFEWLCGLFLFTAAFQLHSSAEQLSSCDAWHCPTCDRKQQGVKRLMLWSAPQILVLHLKRFRQVSKAYLHSDVRYKL